MALAALGEIEELNALVQEVDAGVSTAQLAWELRAHGYGEAAREMLFRAIDWLENRSPEQKKGAGHRWQLARLFIDVGRLDEAGVILEGLVQEYPEAGSFQAALGVVAARQGNREKASKISRLLEELARSRGRPPVHDTHAYRRAWIAAALGDREQAVELLREWGPWFLTTNVYQPHSNPFLQPLRDYPPFQELLRPKG